MWCTRAGFSVNPDKTELVLFTKRRKIEGFRPPIFYGSPVPLSNEVKYLGVILDTKLCFGPHLVNKCQRATAAFWQVRRVAAPTWGANPKVVLWLYTAIIRPMLTYAAVVWWPRVKLVVAQTCLNRVQRMACLCSTGAMRGTPTLALQVLLNLPPLHIFVEMEAMAACYRLKRVGEWRFNTAVAGHLMIAEQMGTKVPLLAHRSDFQIPSFDFEKSYTVLIPSRLEWDERGVGLLPPDSLVCYTDGSRMAASELSGAGVHFEGQGVDLVFPLGKFATVFQAEVFAILSCAREAVAQNYRGGCFCICSDSQAALKALESPKMCSALVKECSQVLQGLAVQKAVRLVWVPGHVGVAGNEQADALAREGSNTPFVGPEPVLGISPRSGRLALRRWAERELANQWRAPPNCRQAKLFISQPSGFGARQLLKLSRRKLRALVGILTGHCPVNRHLNIMGLVNDPLCPFCGREEETALHFVGRCEHFSAIRLRLFGRYPLQPEEIQTAGYKELLRFLRETGRFD